MSPFTVVGKVCFFPLTLNATSVCTIQWYTDGGINITIIVPTIIHP